ncbi:putative ABC transport system permease protein [Saccharothrix saharensis]|uniref:Putative ABC transport system permease protein n=1 Tax=Saccharothrix saharensis TaxID=571190 RepID=A0A543JLI8_9PSEU|nr:FtsX-like permease family protein [Saccharothrix saharensis]TQM83675.1 putative ABC transport system permease protein [Saccharothrix saharensis]
MLRTIIAGLKARTARLVLSSVAIALGVAFVTGTLVLGDAMNASLRDEFAKSARNVDVSVTVSGEPSSAEEVRGITPETLARIRQAPGVAGADPRDSNTVPLVAANGKAKTAWAVSLASNEKLREFDLVDGRYPAGDDEIAVDQRTATTAKLTIGQPVVLLGKGDVRHTYTLVGTYQQGTNPLSLSGFDHVGLTPEAFQALEPERPPYQVVATAAPGFTQQQVADNVRQAIGGQGYRIQTGDELTKETLERVESQAGEFTTVLLAFAIIALVVAAMVIYNTFTILVAQRTRELALMRCVGASRGQVFRGVLAEALVMGLTASVIGLFGGIGVSALLQRVIFSFDGGEGTVQLPVTVTTVLAAFAVGTLITVLAAVLPARKATRVAPVAALRSQPDSGEEVSRTGVLRVLTAVLFAVVGVGAVVFGMNLEDEDAAMFISGAGTMALLAAVLVLGPLLVGPVNRVLGAVPRALLGVPAKLASANAGRNPKRTAATTAALMIGVTIVSLVTVVANSAKETANAEIDQRMPADYTVTSAVYDRPLPKELADELAAVPEVARVAPTTVIYGERGYFTGVPQDAIGTLFRPTATSGSLADLREGTIAVNAEYAKREGVSVGSTVTLKEGGSNESQQLKVVAVVEGQRLSDGIMTAETAQRFPRAAEGYDSILVKLKDSATNGRAAVEKVTDPSPLALVDSAAETKEQLNKQLNQVLGFIWALIGLAVVIALFGIANTLTLSVLERTRESALLRALGLTKGQLRLMLVVESVLMALMGAAIGLLLGIGFGWVITEALSNDTLSVDLVVPFGQIGVMLAGAVVAAVVAAALPARRAARTSVVAGMAEA